MNNGAGKDRPFLMLEKWLFTGLCLLTILPVWLFPHFLTADGPCHVYNAGILYDMLHGQGEFFHAFYIINTQPEPNWFSHAVIMLLMHVFSGVIAEKILLTGCILLFVTGFRALLKQLSPHNLFLSLWIFPFVWQLAMLMGFYNYMYSLGLAFWLSALYIRHKDDLDIKKIVTLTLGFTLLYFMHLFGTIIAFIICGLSIVTNASDIKKKAKTTGLLLLPALPALLLIGAYIARNYTNTNNAGRPGIDTLINNLNNLNSLFGLTALDIKLSMKMSFVLQATLVIGIISFFIKRPSRKILIPLSLLLLFAALYFFSSETTLGGSYIRPRLESLIYIFVVALVSFAAISKYFRLASIVLATTFSVAFTVNKLGAFRDINLFMEEMHQAGTRVKDRSLVLPLNLERYLRNKDSVVINNNVLLFAHSVERIAGGKQIIFMDNYEATTGYFPLIWKAEKNPFIHLAVNDGIEGEPPQVDILKYNAHSAPIDYIIMWGKKKEATEHPAYPALVQEVNDNYDLVFTSEVYKVKLYKLRKGIIEQ